MFELEGRLVTIVNVALPSIQRALHECSQVWTALTSASTQSTPATEESKSRKMAAQVPEASTLHIGAALDVKNAVYFW